MGSSGRIVVAALLAVLCIGCDAADGEVDSPPALSPDPATEAGTPTFDANNVAGPSHGAASDSQVSRSAESSARVNSLTAVIDTINSIIRVRNTGAAWGAGDTWSVKEVFRIGAVDDPPEELFGPLIRVGLSPTGAITVVDPQASLVSMFDRSGKFVRTFGRPGNGPGELLNPTAMTWDDAGHLWLAHAFNGRYTVFDSLGGVVRTLRRPIQGTSSKHQLVFDEGGSLIDQAPGRGGFVPFFRVDTSGVVVDTLIRMHYPPIRYDRPMPSNFDRSVLRYLAGIAWALAPDGTIWSAESGALRLIQRNLAGDTIRIVETDHRDDLALDGPTQRRVEAELSKLGPDFDYTLARPVVAAIDVLTDGYVLVQIVEEVGKPSELHDVFDPHGRFLGSIRFGFPVSPRGVSAFVGDTILAVSLGDLDVPYVVRAHIQR